MTSWQPDASNQRPKRSLQMQQQREAKDPRPALKGMFVQRVPSNRQQKEDDASAAASPKMLSKDERQRGQKGWMRGGEGRDGRWQNTPNADQGNDEKAELLQAS